MNARLKEPKKIIRDLFLKYATIEENVVHADKLFIINTVINYVFKNNDYRTIDKKLLLEYGELLNRYLKNEVDIYWQGDTIMVKELDSVGEQTSGD